MDPSIMVKEEVYSPSDSLLDAVFDRFDGPEGVCGRKLSCSSNESSLSSNASSDSGYSFSELIEKRDNYTGERQLKTHSANGPAVKKNLEMHLSNNQKEKVQVILDSVQRLSDTEKLLLYLKLPSRDQEQAVTTLSTAKQEQTFAFQWIRDNLEQCDSSENLPKHEVYDQYRAHCEKHSAKRFLSAPDFGKIVKCMFPNVKARRLGTRGNSKYCYNGLRRKVPEHASVVSKKSQSSIDNSAKLGDPSPITTEHQDSAADQTVAAACVLVCEWANKLLGRFFTTLIELAKFLVGGSYVSTKSMAALTVMSASAEKIESLSKRFGLEALVKSVKREPDAKVKNTKPVCIPVKTVSEEYTKFESSTNSSQTVQVVPQTPTKNSKQLSDQNQNTTIKLEECTIDVSAPVYLDNLKQDLICSTSDCNVIVSDMVFTQQQSNPNNTSSSTQTTSTNNAPNSTPKKEKKLPDKLSISKFQQPRENYSTNIPSSSPLTSRKTPKKVGRPRSLKKTNSSPYPASSRGNQTIPDVMAQRFLMQHQAMPPPPSVGMQMHPNQNRFAAWSIPSPVNVENELHSIFLNSRLATANNLPDLQRCQSVPVPQNNGPNDVLQPLTPQVHLGPRGDTVKAKRDLTSLFFGDNPMQEAPKSLTSFHTMPEKVNQDFRQNISYMNNNFHSNERVVPSGYTEQNSRSFHYNHAVVPSNTLQNNLPNRPTQNYNVVNDFGSILTDLPTPDELIDIPSSFGKVDSDELLNSLRTADNIWANEWNGMSLMNA